MKTYFVWVCLVSALAFSARAETAAAELLKGRSVEQWVERLGSDVFKEREEASLVLGLGGKGVEAALRKAVASSDAEVSTRAKIALSAQEVKSIEGDFVRVESISTSDDGLLLADTAAEVPATVTIKKGKLVFKQDYGNGVEQVYSFAEATSLEFRQKCTIAMTWVSINKTSLKYYPDNDDPKLEFVNSERGVRLVFSARDTNGTLMKMIFVPKSEVEKKPDGNANVPPQGRKKQKLAADQEVDFN